MWWVLRRKARAPLFLSNGQLFVILLFDTFKFVACHSSDTVCIVVIRLEVAILVFKAVLSKGLCLAATSTDLLGPTIQWVDFVNVRSKGHLCL